MKNAYYHTQSITSPSLMHETGCSGPVHWDYHEGRDVQGGGKGFRTGNTCTPMADSCECMAKTTTMLQSNLPLTKVRLVKAIVFSVVVYGCESWTVKKAEH